MIRARCVCVCVCVCVLGTGEDSLEGIEVQNLMGKKGTFSLQEDCDGNMQAMRQGRQTPEVDVQQSEWRRKQTRNILPGSGLADHRDVFNVDGCCVSAHNYMFSLSLAGVFPREW